jgi:allophanate hydrolase subunit 2
MTYDHKLTCVPSIEARRHDETNRETREKGEVDVPPNGLPIVLVLVLTLDWTATRRARRSPRARVRRV